MKQTLWIVAALLLLTACSREEPAPTVDDPAPFADEPVAEEPVVPPADAGAIDDQTTEVVEESAAEPEESGEAEILLARADEPKAPPSWQFDEGKHYVRLVPTQPTIGGADKIEVAEFFWYGCAHCLSLEPDINQWEAQKPANVRFERVPAMWNDVLKFHAQLFYTEQVLVRNGQIKDAAGFRSAVFEEYHRRSNRLLSEQAVMRLFERYGVDEASFKKTWSSFEVAQKLRVAADLSKRYSIASVPAIVINGKYRTGATEAGSNKKLIEVIDELVVREGLR